MNTTLTSLALALVLALLVALVGPLMVDWNAHRAILAQHIGDVLGEDVALKGDVSVRLLPMPSIHARQVVVGDADTEGVPTLRVPDFTMKIALIPLIRGVVSIQQVQLERPVLQIWMTDEGNILWPFGGSPTGGVDLSHAQIQRLDVRGGKVELFQPDMPPRRMENIRLSVEAETLLGPYKMTGRGTIGGSVYPFALTTGKLAQDAIRWPVSMQIGNQERFILDGNLTLDNAVPQFQGQLIWKTLWKELPFEMRSVTEADSEGMRFENIAIQFGKTGASLALKGKGAFAFDGTGGTVSLLTDYLDGDRFAATLPENILGTRGSIWGNPAALLPALPPFPLTMNIKADRLMLGGAFVENIQFGLKGTGQGWQLEKARATLPGKSAFALSGRVLRSEFRGKFALDVERPAVFLRWFDSSNEWVSSQVLSKIVLHGEVETDNESIRLHNAVMQLNDDEIKGQMTWLQSTAAGIPHLTLNMSTQHLDLDALMPVLERSRAVWCLWCPVAVADNHPPEAAQAAVEVHRAIPAVLMTFSAAKLERDDALFSRVRFDASFSNGLLALNRFEIGEAPGMKDVAVSGQLPIKGTFEQLALKIRGKLEPKVLLPRVPEAWRSGFTALHGEPFAVVFEANGKGAERFDVQLKAEREGIRLDGKATRNGNAWVNLESTVYETDGVTFGKAFALPVYLLPKGEHTFQFKAAEGVINGKPLQMQYTAGQATIKLDGKRVKKDNRNAFEGDFSITVPQERALRLRGGLLFDAGIWKANAVLGSYADKTIAGELECRSSGTISCQSAFQFEEFFVDDARHVALRMLEQDTPLQGALALKIGRLVVNADTVLQRFTADITANNTQINVKSYDSEWAGGLLKGQMLLSKEGNAARFQTVFDASKLDVSALWHVKPEVATGTVGLKGSLSGTVQADRISNLEGYGTLAVDKLTLASASPEAGFATLQALRTMDPPFEESAVSDMLKSRIETTQATFADGETAFTVQDGKATLPLLALTGESGSVRFAGVLDLDSGGLNGDARFIPRVLPEAQFTAHYEGNWRAPNSRFNASDLVQLAMLRVLDEGSRVLEEREAEQHEHGRLQRELKHLERMREVAQPNP